MNPDRDIHAVIHFTARNIIPKPCPRCHRKKWLGICDDGCEMCQSCYHMLHDLGPLPSDSMDFSFAYARADRPEKVKVRHIRPFDWEYCAENKSRHELNFLRKVYASGISEKKYMAAWEKMRPKLTRGHRSPSYSRHEYRNLRDKFRFL
jgi:hypothetical protein